MCIRQARLEPLALSASSRERYPTRCAANTSRPRSDRFWLRELRVSQHFSTFYEPSVQAVDTQLNALPTLPVLARTVSGCLSSAFLGRRSSRGRRGGERGREVLFQGDSAMRVLVTGGAGFIGSHLCEAYLERGDEVHVLDDLSTGSIDNIRHLRPHPRFDYTIDSVHHKAVDGGARRRLRRCVPPGGGRGRQADRGEPGADDRDQRPRHGGRPGRRPTRRRRRC